MRRLPLPELALFGMTVIWGMSFLTIKWALEGMGPITLTAVRNAVALAALLAVAPKALRATALEWRAGLVAGSIVAIGYLLETAGMQTATASKSGFLAQFYVVLVPFLQAAVFRRRPAWADLGSLLLATAGITVMVVRPGQEISLGEVLVAISTIAWTIQIVLVGRVAPRVDPVRMAAVQILAIAVLSGLSLIFIEEPAPVWRPALVGHVLFLAIGCSSIGFLVQAWAQRSVSPTRTAVVYSGQPIFALAFGAWFMGDVFDGRDVAGAALIMAAVVMAILAPRNEAGAVVEEGSLPA